MASNRFAHLIPPAGGATAPQARQNRFAALIPKKGTPPSDGPQRSNLAEKVGLENGQVQVPRRDAAVPFLQGALLNSADEILPAIGAPIAAAANRMGLLQGDALPGVGDNYDQGQALLRAQQARMEAEHPMGSLGFGIAGGLATAKVPVGTIAKGAGLAGKVARGAATGAAYGAVSGFADGTGAEDRAQKAVDGAAMGVATGVAIPVVARPLGKMVGSAANAVANVLPGSAQRAVQAEAGVGRAALNKVSQAFAEDARTASLKAPTKGDLLMNLGPQLEARTESIASQPGQGRNIILGAVKQQQQGAGARTTAAMDSALGRDAGRVVNQNAIQQERTAAGAMYTAARGFTGKFDLSGVRSALDAALTETDGGVRSALMKARNLHVFRDGVAGQATATQVHAARMAIDEQLARPGVGPNAARLLKDVRSQLDDALKQHVPGWREADQAFSAVMQKRDALDAGRSVFSRSFGSPQELVAELNGMSREARFEFQKGARDAISELMGTARNDAAAAQRTLAQTGWNAEKLRVLIGEKSAANLTAFLDREASRSATRDRVLMNSRTAFREEAKKDFPGAGGTVRPTGRTVADLTIQAADKILGGIVGKRRAEVARQAAFLLSRNAEEVVPILRRAEELAGRRLNLREKLATVSASLALSGSQQLSAHRADQ